LQRPLLGREGGILALVAGHAAADHGVIDVTPDLVAAVRQYIHAI
jgi:hypothetical protein